MADKREPRRGLGRGLSALMADVEAAPAPADATAAPSSAEPRRADRFVPIEHIVPNPDQPRRTFTQDQLEELAASIRAKGIIQPIIVRARPGDERTYEIVAGERRWRAAQLANLHEMPVLVREFTDTEVLEVAIIENIQRADLNAIDEASGYKQLMFKFGHTQEKLAEALGKSRSHIANLLRLLNLPDDVQTLVADGALSAGHARALVTAQDPSALARQVVARKLSVRDTEKLAKMGGEEANKPRKSGSRTRGEGEKDADTRALEGDLSAALGMKVTVDHAPGAEGGRLTVTYESLEQLDALCGMLGTGGGD